MTIGFTERAEHQVQMSGQFFVQAPLAKCFTPLDTTRHSIVILNMGSDLPVSRLKHQGHLNLIWRRLLKHPFLQLFHIATVLKAM